MKRLIILPLMAFSFSVFSQEQTKDLATVNTVKPKPGQKMAFEAAWKQHVTKFHGADHRLNVYEILSGDYAGYYHIVEGNKAFEDFDKTRPDATAHSLDLDKNFFPLLESTKNATYRFMDSLSLRPTQDGEKFIVNVNHLKQGLAIGDYRRELARAVKINLKSTAPFMQSLNVNFYEQLWDGSDQVTVTVRNLKDGFKSLQPNYYGPAPVGSPSFRDDYSKEYGNTAWDERVKLLEGAVVKTEQYIMKLRKDLSTPQ